MNGRPYLLADGRRIGVRGLSGMGPLVASFDALSRYDALGGLSKDTAVRHQVIRELANALQIPEFPDAAVLLADALARRAALKPRS